jgi:hypothetical protein
VVVTVGGCRYARLVYGGRRSAAVQHFSRGTMNEQ